MSKKSKAIKSPFAGYCEHCELMLAEMDRTDRGFKCPACARYSVNPLAERSKQ